MIGRHPAGPGRAGVLRIETAGAVSTIGALIADAGAVGMAGFGQKLPFKDGRIRLYVPDKSSGMERSTRTIPSQTIK